LHTQGRYQSVEVKTKKQPLITKWDINSKTYNKNIKSKTPISRKKLNFQYSYRKEEIKVTKNQEINNNNNNNLKESNKK